MDALHTFISQVHPDSVLIGLALGVALAGVIFLIIYDRMQRQRLILSMHLEQAALNNSDLEKNNLRLRDQRDTLARDNQAQGNKNAALEAAHAGMLQQVEERDMLLDVTRKQVEREFQLLAGKIFSEQNEHLRQQHQSALTLLLNPFHIQLQDFKQKIEDIHERESRDRIIMTREIEQLKQLNKRISQDAVNLTEALQGGNKLQGQWGEMLLEKLLEDAGLRQGSEFDIQVSMKGENNRLRQPDVVVHLPGNRDVIIDSKVSIKAYIAANAEKSEQQRDKLLQKHLDSIKAHVRVLSAKKYHELTGLGSLDFVLLFIPVETAFQLAVERDASLLTNSMNNKVILASPSTLLAILRTIHHLWRMDEQNRNSLIIAKQAGKLYDKFVGFTEAFEEIGARLNQSQQAWHTARKRLSSGQGNLIARTEQLKDLGVQADKKLPDTLQQTNYDQGETA